MTAPAKYYAKRRRQSVEVGDETISNGRVSVTVNGTQDDKRTFRQKFELRSAERDVRRHVEAALGRKLSSRQLVKLRKAAQRANRARAAEQAD